MRGGVSHLVEDSVDGLESTTGLKLRDATIGRTQDATAAAQDKAGSIAQSVQERAAELHKRVSGIAHDVQAAFVQHENPEAKLSPDAPAGLLANSKGAEDSTKDIKQKVEEAVQDVRTQTASTLGVAKGTKLGHAPSQWRGILMFLQMVPEKVDPKNEETRRLV